jgi:invasion protein IalB
MRKSIMLWTVGVTASLLVAGIASGGFQELANAQTRGHVAPAAAEPAVKVQLASAAPTAAAQPAPSAWISRCASVARQSAPICTVAQTATLAKTGQHLATITLRLPAPGEEPVMLIQAPVGLYLPAGISLRIDDGAPTRLVVQTCDLKGCYAGEKVPADLLSAMKTGKRLAIVFQNLAKRDISVPLTLAQFAQTYQRIQ